MPNSGRSCAKGGPFSHPTPSLPLFSPSLTWLCPQLSFLGISTTQASDKAAPFFHLLYLKHLTCHICDSSSFRGFFWNRNIVPRHGRGQEDKTLGMLSPPHFPLFFTFYKHHWRRWYCKVINKKYLSEATVLKYSNLFCVLSINSLLVNMAGTFKCILLCSRWYYLHSKYFHLVLNFQKTSLSTFLSLMIFLMLNVQITHNITLPCVFYSCRDCYH